MEEFPLVFPVNPVVAMRYNQNFYPVPEEFKTSGQYYEQLGEELFQIFDDECCESGVGAAKAEKRLDNFRYTLRNIEYAASCIIRNCYLRYKLKRRLRTGPYIKAIRHNGVNYSSVLYLLLKQRWENYMKDTTDSILNYTCERVTEKINRQRACVLIQRQFRRFRVVNDMAAKENEKWELEFAFGQLSYDEIPKIQNQARNKVFLSFEVKKMMVLDNSTVETEQKKALDTFTDSCFIYDDEQLVRRLQEHDKDIEQLYQPGGWEQEDWLVRGYAEMEAERIEMEAERDAKLEEDMDRMREEYFD